MLIPSILSRIAVNIIRSWKPGIRGIYGPLKALGVYDVPIKLHRDVAVEIKVWVVAD